MNNKNTQTGSMFYGPVDGIRKIVKPEIKILLGIEDELQDPLLDILINNVSSHLYLVLRGIDKEIKGVPSELYFMIVDITVRRFNRVGSEGMKSESVEGHKIDFYDLDQEFDSYMYLLKGYAPDEKAKQFMGKVRLF